MKQQQFSKKMYIFLKTVTFSAQNNIFFHLLDKKATFPGEDNLRNKKSNTFLAIRNWWNIKIKFYMAVTQFKEKMTNSMQKKESSFCKKKHPRKAVIRWYIVQCMPTITSSLIWRIFIKSNKKIRNSNFKKSTKWLKFQDFTEKWPPKWNSPWSFCCKIRIFSNFSNRFNMNNSYT